MLIIFNSSGNSVLYLLPNNSHLSNLSIVNKICLVSGQSVGQGDSGAGLCFFHYDSYYLTGVVSVKDPDSNKYIAVFTEIKYHIQWIRGLYTRYN